MTYIIINILTYTNFIQVAVLFIKRYCHLYIAHLHRTVFLVYKAENIILRKDKYMANFTYKKTEITSMKIAGLLDTDRMLVDVDGDEKRLSALLSPFNGGYIEINIKTKNEEELDEPVFYDGNE